jgi:HlyD family secretion protein
MSKPKKILFFLLFFAAIGFGLFRMTRGDAPAGGGTDAVSVTRGTLVEKALAVGQIVPRQEIQVKSQISGTVKQCFVDVGANVKAGDPLFSISPDPTPLERNEAERDVQIKQVNFAKAQADWDRVESLNRQGILAKGDLDGNRKALDLARIDLAQSRDKLALLKDGKIAGGRGGVDSVIRAPAAGTVLQRLVNPGDPVVPLTTFQAGTPLMSLADMHGLVFKGTVDEIDVGKLKEQMPVRLQIGALPGVAVTGKLTKIAPKAKDKDGATLFDVEAELNPVGGAVLRAGFSANADIVIQEKPGVLMLPERVVLFEGEKTFIELPPVNGKAKPEKKSVKLGLSDGLNVEIAEGLKEGDKVFQRPPKKVE